MPLQLPDSVDDCVYFTRRAHAKGQIICWVPRGKCPKCGKGTMTKPVDEKTGKYKIRAKEYSCRECGYTVDAEAYGETLTANIIYTCPHCGHKAETSIPFKRKKAKIFYEAEAKQKTVELLRFPCGKCGKNVDITKKMK